MSTAGGRITAGVGANLIGQHAQDRNQEATVYVGNLDPQASSDPELVATVCMSPPEPDRYQRLGA